MIEVEWRLAPEQRERFAPFLERAIFYAPPWLRAVTVRESSGDDGCLLSIGVMQEYRVASLRCDPAWFAESEHEQLIAAIHEALHAHFAGLSDVYEQMAKALEPDENAPLRKWAAEQYRRAEEAAISDLSRAIAARESLIP